MSIRDVKVTLTSNRNDKREISGDERRCCVEAEEILRSWFWDGYTVALDIRSSDTQTRMRVCGYLADVSRELGNEPRVLL